MLLDFSTVHGQLKIDVEQPLHVFKAYKHHALLGMFCIFYFLLETDLVLMAVTKD